MSSQPACEYLKHKGGDGPGRGYEYCNHRGVQVRPGEGSCEPGACRHLRPKPTSSAAPIPAPGEIVPLSHCPIVAPVAPAPVPAPAPASAGATPSPEENTIMPAIYTRAKIAWDAPANETIPDAPCTLPLWEHCREQLAAHAGERGFRAGLAKACGCVAASILSAIDTRERPAAAPEPPAVSPAPEGPSPSQTGISMPVPAVATRAEIDELITGVAAMIDDEAPKPLPVPPDDDIMSCLATGGHLPIHASFSTRQYCIQEGWLLPDLSDLTESGKQKLAGLAYVPEANPPAAMPSRSELAITIMLTNTGNDVTRRTYDLISSADAELLTDFIVAHDLTEMLDEWLSAYRAFCRRFAV